MAAVLASSPSSSQPQKPAERESAPVQSPLAKGGFSFGKYRGIIFAVALFLIFDLAVLVLNFYTSFQISEDAVGINLAGRQRMLSQRTAKAILGADSARSKTLPIAKELEELQVAVNLFDVTLKGFQTGATIPGGDLKPVYLKPAEGDKAAQILKDAGVLWDTYKQRLAPVLAGNYSDDEFNALVDYAKINNLKLLGLMNQLTTALEANANARAATLRMVQTGGIVLALLNFAFILFKFLRRLNTSDAAIDAATEETREILTSVREGLFLLTPQKQLGSQISLSTHELFGRKLQPGQDFFDVLGALVSTKVLSDGQDYVELLFSPHVKEQLVQGINPLSEVQVTIKNRLGQAVTRYLAFHFNRVLEGKAVKHLLVTVQDISPLVELQARLQGERQHSQKEFSMLLKAFEADPSTMRSFVERSEAALLEINDLLRSTSSASSEMQVLKTVDGAFRRIHAFKGDAASLGLDVLATLAHQFENELQKLKNQGAASGDALLALPLPLEDLLDKVATFKLIGARKGGSASSTPPSAQALQSALTKLANEVGADVGKRVVTSIHMQGIEDISANQVDKIRDLAIQLVRNAVVHGIETPQTRAASGKAAEGQLLVNLVREGTHEWQLSVRDDGAGLNAERIRRKLVELSWYSPEQLESFSEKQVVAHIFKPGFSTVSTVDKHAGRGVGLDLVQTTVQSMGARLLLASVAGQYTEFKIIFSS